ncbi:MAG: hypothetical protein D6785_09445, partial [Planctomycetota bacterium]
MGIMFGQLWAKNPDKNKVENKKNIKKKNPKPSIPIQHSSSPKKLPSKRQEVSSLESQRILVTATRKKAKIFDVPYYSTLMDAKEVQNAFNNQTLSDLFKYDPTILGQKTGNAQGSPYLRGFTGFRNLLLIDGFRLNNSVFREGPNQYWSTIDPFIIRQIEIVKGSGSVLYGSDAVGGTVQILSKSPKYTGKAYWKNKALYRYGSADSSHTSRVESLGYFNSQIGFIGGFSFKDYNDLVAGRHVGLQPKTGYEQMDGDAKLLVHLSPKTYMTFAYQGTRQMDAWRTHKTIYGISWHGTSVGKELKRILDQERQLAYWKIQGKEISSYLDSFM